MTRAAASGRRPRMSVLRTTDRVSTRDEPNDPGRQPVITDTLVFLFPSSVAAARTKAAKNTTQWQSFKASLDSQLSQVVSSQYYYDAIPRAADYALGYQGLAVSNNSTALDYAGKAIGLALSGIRDSHRSNNNSVQFIAQGNGSTTTFALPGTQIITGSVVAYSTTLTATPITKGTANGTDNLGLFNSLNTISKIVKIVSSNSVTASPAYTSGTDYFQNSLKTGVLSEEVIDWSLGGSEPTTSTTYYVVSAPIGNNADIVSGSNYSIVGTNIVFNTAPANNKAIFVSCLYHTSNLRYQQTGNGLGGVPTLSTSNNFYPSRFLALGIATTFDWCYQVAGFTSNQTEVANALVAFSDMSRDNPYADASWVESNYGAGHYVNRSLSAIAIQGRQSQAVRLQVEIENLYTTFINAKFQAPLPNQTSLKGGFTGEGLSSFGQDATEYILLGTQAIADTGWNYDPISPTQDVRTWASEVIKFNIHSRYSETVNNYSSENRPGSVYEGGDNSDYPVASISKRIYAIASGISEDVYGNYARFLIANKSGDVTTYNAWDLLFYDPNGIQTDWTTDPTIGLTHTTTGRGVVLSRADWSYTSPWLAFACGNRGDSYDDEPGAGDLTLYKGSDKLLVSAAAIGERLNPDPSGPWSNIVTIDDGGAQLQTNRWSSTSVFGDFQNTIRPGVTLKSVDKTTGYVWISADYSAIYASSQMGTNPCTTLNCEVVFIPTSGYVFRYDRVVTSSANYSKHLRYHSDATTQPVGSGTITLSNGSSTSALAWNASAATIQAALRALSGTGYSTVVVSKLCDGYWIANFTSPSPTITVASLSGTSSVGGAIVEIYDYHPEGVSGARTIQHIVLAKTISGTQQHDVNSSRIFLRVDDSSDALTKTQTLIDASQSGGALCQRLSFRPTSPTASTRFATAIQLTTTAKSSMDTTLFLTGMNTQLEGYLVGSTIVLFLMNSSFTPPDTISVTATGTLTWNIFGLTPDTTYSLGGSTTVVTNNLGTAVFTTSTTNPSITISAYSPSIPTVTFVRTPVNLGITSDLVSWYAAEQARQSTSTPAWQLWQVCPTVGTGDGSYPWLMVGHHVGAGLKYYRNNYISVGNTLVGAFSDVTSSQLGGSSWLLGQLGGIMAVYDIDGDGQVDHACIKATASPAQDAWKIVSSVLVDQAGISLDGSDNYVEDIGDFDSNGTVDVRTINWPAKTALTALSSAQIRTLSWNGTSYSTSTASFALPGVPSGVAADCLARLRAASADAGRLYLFNIDLDNDNILDLIIFGAFSQESQSDFIYYLKNDGAGNYTDKTSAWGLSRNGTFLPIQPYWACHYPKLIKCDSHLQQSIDGTGVTCLFIGGGDFPGYYKWNGTSYVKQTSSLTTMLQQATGSLGATDDYLATLYAVDLTNSGRLDLIYHRPGNGAVYVFLNDGTGVFAQNSGGGSPFNYFRAWAPYGMALVDLNNDGLVEMVLGGNDGSTNGGAASLVLTCYRNDTTFPGNYIKIKLRRGTT